MFKAQEISIKTSSMKKLLCITIIVLSVIHLFAQNEPWIRISPKPIESSLKDITQIPGTNRVMAIGSGASILYTDDMGTNWHVMYQPAEVSRFITFNAIHFVNSNIGYMVGSKSTMLKTEDGGINWLAITLSGNHNIYDVFFHDELHGSIIRNGYVFKTTDGCLAWDSIAISGSGLQYINDTIGYIGNTNNQFYYKTIDAGNTWNPITVVTSLTNFKIEATNFQNELEGSVSGSDVNNYSYILKTNDGGITWNEVIIPNLTWYNDFYFYNADTGFAIGATFYKNVIIKTNDGGNSWTESTMPYTSWWMQDMIFSDQGVGICIGDHGQILKSDNWGDDWVTNDNHQLILREIKTKAIIDDNTIIIGGDMFNGDIQGTIYRSDDGGDNWEHSLGGNGTFGITCICFPSSEIGYACGPYSVGRLLKSTNGGISWFEIYFPDYYFKPRVVYFFNDQVGLVGGEDDDFGCYKTIDGGTTWHEITGGFPPNYVIDFAFVDDSTGWAVLDDGGILKTTDQGENWEIYYELGFDSFNKMKFITDSIGFVVGFKFYKTIDAGQSWYEVGQGYGGFYDNMDIDFPTNQIGYVTIEKHETTIIKTIDCGETWFPIDFPCTATATTVGFFNENEGLAMGSGGIIFKTYTGGIVDIPEFPANIEDNNKLLCYPVPTSNLINVEVEYENQTYPEKVIIYNYSGKKVIDKEILPNQKSIQINISGLKPGIYLIATLSNGNIIRTGKVIKTD